jgi:hypothetical protein
MYAMYLLSTTNYKEFAESLIKNTSRTLESIKIHEDNIAETYGIKVLIKDTTKSCSDKRKALDRLVHSSEMETFLDDGYGWNSCLQKEKNAI